jgi:hypothetical protein
MSERSNLLITGARFISAGLAGASVLFGILTLNETSTLNGLQAENAAAKAEGDQYLQGYDQGQVDNEASEISFFETGIPIFAAMSIGFYLASGRRRKNKTVVTGSWISGSYNSRSNGSYTENK